MKAASSRGWQQQSQLIGEQNRLRCLLERLRDAATSRGDYEPHDVTDDEAAIQADEYIKTGDTGKPEKQSIDMVLLTPENACQYTQFAPNGKTSCP